MPGMPYPSADLHLRGSRPIRVTWTGEAPAPLVVHLGHEPRLDTPAVVLAVTNFDDAASVLQWCADHGAELGGDPRRLILAGDQEAAGVVAALARQARNRGWPPIERTVISSHRGDTMIVTETYFAISRRVAAPRDLVFQAWLGESIAFREIDAPRRLLFDLEDDGLAIVTLSEEGVHTVMTFEGSAPEDEADGVEREWSARLDALAETVGQASQSGGNAGGIRPG
jgi:alpha/beta hydrolase fold